jgi:hypothetical protein
MKEGDEIRFEGPIGDFSLRESERPIVFVAGATGFAPVKSMVEDAFQRGLKREIHLYWGVKTLKDLYLPDCRRWAREHANFHFIPVLSEPAPEDPGADAPAWSMKRFSRTSRNSSSTRSTPAARCAWSRRSSPSSSSTAPRTAPASRMPSASRHARWRFSHGGNKAGSHSPAPLLKKDRTSHCRRTRTGGLSSGRREPSPDDRLRHFDDRSLGPVAVSLPDESSQTSVERDLVDPAEAASLKSTVAVDHHRVRQALDLQSR